MLNDCQEGLWVLLWIIFKDKLYEKQMQDGICSARPRDANRRQDLDMKFMFAPKQIAMGASVKKCSHCGATVPMQASFCGECGSKLG